MGYLLAAQGAVAWQQRGIVTSAVQFFRTIGGAIGIGLLGALFNVLIGPKLETLASRGVSAAALLDPHSHAKLPADVVAMARHMIAGSLIWVFAAMVFFALVGVVVTSFMARGKAEHVSRSEALEAMAG
jgi:hypothetical protein